jgi:hypothetical protein
MRNWLFLKHEISRNGQLVSRNNETRFASSFAKQKAKRVSLETLLSLELTLKLQEPLDELTQKNLFALVIFENIHVWNDRRTWRGP